MKQKILLFNLLLLSFLSSNCKKKCDDTTTNTPTQLMTGTWSVGYIMEKTVDDAGKVISTNTIAPTFPPSGITGLQANGRYFTLNSQGTWELSADGKKTIYDKNTADERYYTILYLTADRVVSIGPYRLNGQLYFSNKLWEYEGLK